MPDTIRKRFGYGHLWLLRPACSQNRPGSYMPDPTSRIRFSSVFAKKAWIMRRTDLDLIWMAWSGSGQTDPVRKQAGVQESSSPLLASASQLIRTGCESDPTCLLGTVAVFTKSGTRLLSSPITRHSQ